MTISLNDLLLFIGAIVWACDQWRRRHPKPQRISDEKEIKRAAEAGRKIREAELEYQARRTAKQQAKLTDAVMRGLEHHLGPEYQLKDGVLFTEQDRPASFPGLSPPLFADVAKAESWLEANGQRGTVWAEDCN
jgi:hypothetical protein